VPAEKKQEHMDPHTQKLTQSTLVILGTVGLLNVVTVGLHGVTKLSHCGTGTRWRFLDQQSHNI